MAAETTKAVAAAATAEKDDNQLCALLFHPDARSTVGLRVIQCGTFLNFFRVTKEKIPRVYFYFLIFPFFYFLGVSAGSDVISDTGLHDRQERDSSGHRVRHPGACVS